MSQVRQTALKHVLTGRLHVEPQRTQSEQKIVCIVIMSIDRLPPCVPLSETVPCSLCGDVEMGRHAENAMQPMAGMPRVVCVNNE